MVTQNSVIEKSKFENSYLENWFIDNDQITICQNGQNLVIAICWNFVLFSICDVILTVDFVHILGLSNQNLKI